MRKQKFNNVGFAHLGLVLLVLVLAVVGGTGLYVYRSNHKTKPATTVSKSSSTQPAQSSKPSAPKTTTPTPKPDPYAGWKTYTSPSEGFSIRYPTRWKVIPLQDYSTKGSADFQAPDGLIVRYVELNTSGTTDSDSCGHGSACLPQHILSIDSLAVPNYGTVSVVKTAPGAGDEPCYAVYLDQPSGAATTPKIGENSYSDHFILFSLPSKIGGRFMLWVTNSRAGNTTLQCSSMSQEQFFGLQSVQQAELILKSISYKS